MHEDVEVCYHPRTHLDLQNTALSGTQYAIGFQSRVGHRQERSHTFFPTIGVERQVALRRYLHFTDNVRDIAPAEVADSGRNGEDVGRGSANIVSSIDGFR